MYWIKLAQKRSGHSFSLKRRLDSTSMFQNHRSKLVTRIVS